MVTFAILNTASKQAAATQAGPMSQTKLREALDLLKADSLRTGKDWENAHQICQANEGAQIFDWIHALIHRIEGDDANAGYWYRRAGKSQHPGSVEEEWHLIRSTVNGT